LTPVIQILVRANRPAAVAKQAFRRTPAAMAAPAGHGAGVPDPAFSTVWEGSAVQQFTLHLMDNRILEHDQEKHALGLTQGWRSVFRKGHAQLKRWRWSMIQLS
jgi:hypothetical protein